MKFITWCGEPMADFNSAIPKTLAREGGSKFTDIPGDAGGATKFGISQRAYPNEDIRNLTESRAREIYKRDYWDRVREDEIESQAIAEQIFDTAVNMGVRTGYSGRLPGALFIFSLQARSFPGRRINRFTFLKF